MPLFPPLTLLLSYLLGVIYTAAIGFGNLPFGLGESVLQLGFLGSTFVLIIINTRKSRWIPSFILPISLFILGLLLAIWPMLTTSPLMRPLNTAVLLFIDSMLLVTLYRTSGVPHTATDYVKSLLWYVGITFYTFMELVISLRALRMLTIPGLHAKRPSKDVTLGILVAIPVLWIFHFLFAQINAEYALFIAKIFAEFWRIFWLIIDIDFIIYMCQVFVATLVFATMLSTRQEDLTTDKKQTIWFTVKTLCIILGLTIALFGIFSSFQGKLLFINVKTLPFKELSLYTQKGFWELVTVAVFGYALCLFMIKRIHANIDDQRVTRKKGPDSAQRPNRQEKGTKWTSDIANEANYAYAETRALTGGTSAAGPVEKTLKYLLTLFTLELLAITIFSYHKLGSLIWLFGLKDQRILAFCAVTLITMTFVLFLFRLFDRVKNHHIFWAQTFGLVGITLACNIINLDQLVTNVYPIHYYVEEKPHKDYSYLLGNSYDNYGSWLSLMQEAQKQPCLEQPDDYYWGWYKPIRNYRVERIVNYLTEKPERSYLEDRYEMLTRKYATLTWNRPLPELARFNLREYQAYQLIQAHRSDVDTFLQFAKTPCVSEESK